MSNEKILPDPSALGLFGLAIVTLVASSQKLDITSGVSLVIPWAIFLGSFAQLIACVLDYKKGNIFGGTAFGAFGLFWLGVAMTWSINLGMFGQPALEQADTKQLGFAFLGYLIFTLYMTIAATQTNKVLFLIFVLIDFLFIGLSLSTLGIAPEFGHKLAAFSEFLIAMFSFYASAANILSIQFKKTILPIGKPFKLF